MSLLDEFYHTLNFLLSRDSGLNYRNTSINVLVYTRRISFILKRSLVIIKIIILRILITISSVVTLFNYPNKKKIQKSHNSNESCGFLPCLHLYFTITSTLKLKFVKPKTDKNLFNKT